MDCFDCDMNNTYKQNRAEFNLQHEWMLPFFPSKTENKTYLKLKFDFIRNISVSHDITMKTLLCRNINVYLNRQLYHQFCTSTY